MSDESTIKCPQCDTEINVNEVLYAQFKDKFDHEHTIKKNELDAHAKEQTTKLKQAVEDLKKQEKDFEDTQAQFEKKLEEATAESIKIEKKTIYNELKKKLEEEQSESNAILEKELAEKSEQVKELNKNKAQVQKLKREKAEAELKIRADTEVEFNTKLQEERKKLSIEQTKVNERLKKEIQEEQRESILSLQKDLDEKSEQVKELNNSKIKIEKLKRERDEATSAAKVEAQLALSQELKLEKEKLGKIAIEEKQRIKKEIQDSNELKLKAKDEQIEQMKRDIENARRKAEQGSMQIQGEALELTIESWLDSQFAFDSIEEIKKGAFGADCVQKIHTRELQNCGTICYESKNTKAWSDTWITKLKQDMLTVNADIGVLVTSAYPKNVDRMCFIDGIWVCSLEEFKGSASLLRESLIRVHQTSKLEENKGEKMALLYTYMTGKEFSMQMKAIVDGFINMQGDLDREKRSLMASWKRRQKTIDGVLANTTEMYGALQGIAGATAIERIDALELELPTDIPELEKV